MQISAADWNRYINRLAKVNEAAANQMREYIRRHGTDNVDALIQMANAIATKYGEAAAAVTCDMYDAIAEAQGAELAPAVPAMTPSIEETGNVVRSAMRRAPAILADEIGKLVKKTSTRTMRKNAARDDALMALVPRGDGCPFCKMLGSRGWEPARASKSFEAHLHSNCRCEYVVRFGDDLEVEGYDPDALYEEFQQYEGSWDEKMKAMRQAQSGQYKETVGIKKGSRNDFLNDYIFPYNILEKDIPSDTMGLRDVFAKRTIYPLFRTGGMAPEDYALAKEMWNKVEELDLPQKEKEWVYQELDNNLTAEEKKDYIVCKAIGDYYYRAVNKGHNQYKIFKKEPIDPYTDWMDEVMSEIFGRNWRNFDT